MTLFCSVTLSLFGSILAVVAVVATLSSLTTTLIYELPYLLVLSNPDTWLPSPLLTVADGNPRLSRWPSANGDRGDSKHDHQFSSADLAQSVPVQERQFPVQDAQRENNQQSTKLRHALWTMQERNHNQATRSVADDEVPRNDAKTHGKQMHCAGVCEHGLHAVRWVINTLYRTTRNEPNSV